MMTSLSVIRRCTLHQILSRNLPVVCTASVSRCQSTRTNNAQKITKRQQKRKTNPNLRTESRTHLQKSNIPISFDGLRWVDFWEADKWIQHVSEMLTSPGGPSEKELKRLLYDERVEQLTHQLHHRVEQLTLPALLSAAQALCPDDLFLTKSLERRIIWLLRSAKVRDIIKVMAVYQVHNETTQRRAVGQQCTEQLLSRSGDLTRPQDLLTTLHTVLHTAHHSHSQFLRKLELEGRAREMCNIHINKVLFITSNRQRLNKTLLRLLVATLCETDLTLTPPQLNNLLSSCANLHIFDKQLLTKVTDAILAKATDIEDPHVAAGMLQSVSSLRWRRESLVDMLCEVVVGRLDQAQSSDLVSVLLTCAHLDYLPRAVSVRLEELTDKLFHIRQQSPRQWLDAVWSCAVLQCASPKMVDSVLDKTFQETIQGSTEIINIKLRNIASAARFEIAAYKGSVLDEGPVKVPVRLNRLALGSVIKAMSSLAPAEKYLRLDVPHSAGFNIDIELTVTDQGRPVPKDTTPPPGAKRLAIKVLDFPDVTLTSGRPIGLHTMASRHLGYHGYHVMQVLHTEFDKLRTEVQRVQYLEERIAATVSPDQSES